MNECWSESFFTFVREFFRTKIDFKMEGKENQERRDGVFSRAVRAGKRTYFFDVKATRGDEKYLTVTESKRRFSNEMGKFVYEKHKLFLYREDFEKFVQGLTEAINYVETGELPPDYGQDERNEFDVNFEDLGE